MDEVLDEAKVGCPVGGAIHAADKRF